MAHFTFDTLQYSMDRKGPWRLYIYEPDGKHHRGGQWFRKPPLQYPDEEITAEQALELASAAILDGREVRVCDSGDLLVYHAKGLVRLYPPDDVNFWEEIGAL